MRIIPINNKQTNFGSYYPLTEEEIYSRFGKIMGEHINRAMTDLVPIAHIDGAGLDVIVKTIENKDKFEKGIAIAVADEKSNICCDYILHGNMKNCPHVKGSIFLKDVPQLEMLSKVICNTAKGLIEAYKNCSKNPQLFEYYSKIFK